MGNIRFTPGGIRSERNLRSQYLLAVGQEIFISEVCLVINNFFVKVKVCKIIKSNDYLNSAWSCLAEFLFASSFAKATDGHVKLS